MNQATTTMIIIIKIKEKSLLEVKDGVDDKEAVIRNGKLKQTA